jgi:hypothetical protein
MKTFISILLAFTFAQDANVRLPERMEPVDEATADSQLLRTRDAILRAAGHGDLATIWRHTAPDVFAGFSAQRGIPALRRAWGVDRSPKRFLSELQLVLSLGGRFEGPEKNSFVAPSMFARFPREDLMATHWVVIRPKAPVYARQSVTSPVLRRATFDVFPTEDAYKGSLQGWARVTLPDGRKGYMLTKDIRNISESHAHFTKTSSGWKMTGFYQGID